MEGTDHMFLIYMFSGWECFRFWHGWHMGWWRSLEFHSSCSFLSPFFYFLVFGGYFDITYLIWVVFDTFAGQQDTKKKKVIIVICYLNWNVVFQVSCAFVIKLAMVGMTHTGMPLCEPNSLEIHIWGICCCLFCKHGTTRQWCAHHRYWLGFCN